MKGSPRWWVVRVNVNQSQAEQTGRRLIRRLHVHVHVNQSQAEQTGRRLARRLARRPPFLPKNRAQGLVRTHRGMWCLRTPSGGAAR